MLEQTRSMLAQMKCYGILESMDHRLAEATGQGWSHLEFLSAAVTDETRWREAQKIKRRIKAANFRTDACLERFDFTAKRSITKAQVADLMELTFVTAPRNVLIFGPTGVGKTFLATALGNQACRRGYTTYFVGVNLLIERLSMSRADGSFFRLREKLVKCDLLILDDLGIKRLPPETVQDLYDIMEERYQSRATAITTQLPLANWKEVIEDPVALEAIVDRLIHGALTINLSGETYRKKRALLAKSLDKA